MRKLVFRADFMLLSVIISLVSTKASPILGALGRPIQAWFLNQISLKRLDLAQSLHDENISKPYTVSTLLDRHGQPHKAGEWLKEGQECYFRLTSMNIELSELILAKVLRDLPKMLTLYKMDFKFDGYTFDQHDHPWAGQTSFSDIAQNSEYVKTPRDIHMEFVSPTAFRTNGNDIAIPVPQQIFRSLLQKWNKNCPESMVVDDRWVDFAADCILVSELTSVNTVHWEFAEGTRGTATGFTGMVKLTLLPKTKVNTAWQPYLDGAEIVMQSLARFALYCGVGHHTTIGMGQTRLLESSKKRNG